MAQSPLATEQLSLPLWVPSPPAVAVRAEQTAPQPRVSRSRRLEEALRARLGPATKVLLTDTRSVLASQSRRGPTRTVRVHQLFLDAPPPVLAALAHFLDDGDKAAGAVVDEFIAAQEHLLALHTEPLPEGAHRGQHHDLRPLFHALNARYFDESLMAELTWGQTGAFRGRSRRSITLGSYDYRARRITMHPVLDQAAVPPLCVARVLHHEMCHARHPAETSSGGRRLVHTPAFRREEARFEGAAEADGWLRQHLDTLLRYRSPKTAPVPRTAPRGGS